MVSVETPKKFLIASCLLAMIGTILGAFAAHAFKHTLTPYQQQILHTGIFYQFIHSMALFGTGLLLFQFKSKLIEFAGYLLLVGIFLFSGSLYALTFTQIKWLGIITPLGGLCFILGWLALAVGIYKIR